MLQVLLLLSLKILLQKRHGVMQKLFKERERKKEKSIERMDKCPTEKNR
jgi:hypothetical protein